MYSRERKHSKSIKVVTQNVQHSMKNNQLRSRMEVGKRNTITINEISSNKDFSTIMIK